LAGKSGKGGWGLEGGIGEVSHEGKCLTHRSTTNRDLGKTPPAELHALLEKLPCKKSCEERGSTVITIPEKRRGYPPFKYESQRLCSLHLCSRDGGKGLRGKKEEGGGPYFKLAKGRDFF